MDSIKVRVRDVVHRSDTFYILSAEPIGKDLFTYGNKITCKGNLFGINGLSYGVTLELLGKWINHPKFGRQFDIHGWAPWADTSDGVESFLKHCLSSLDFLQIEVVVDTFGTDTFRVLSEEPNKLLGLLGFDSDTVASFATVWGRVSASSDLTNFFSNQSVTSDQLKAILQVFGAEARKVISENPYRLMEVPGITFAVADEISHNMGITSNDPRRYEGAVLWVLQENACSGHLCVRRGELAPKLLELVRTSGVEDFEESTLVSSLRGAILALVERGAIQVDPNVGAYLTKYFKFERDSASLLAGFLTPGELSLDATSFLSDYESFHSIHLSEAQREAVEKLVTNRVLVLTGLPGTGKTTIVRAFVELFQRAGLSFALMAPTGIAAKKLSSVTGQQAFTVHRALKYNGDTWGYNSQSKYSVGAVILDESSMVDQELFFRVVDSLEPGTMLVLVGDDAQLPSVGPGSVLRELIQCPDIPTVRLTQIFRQAQESSIVSNSHRVNRGESIEVGGNESDFRFISIQDEGKIADLIVSMAVKLKDRDANFQVLSPKYDGIVGVNNLNSRLQEVLNEPSNTRKEFSRGNLKFREGDRLMVIKNDYQLGVFNGDIGKLLRVTKEYLEVIIYGGGGDLDKVVTFPVSDVLIKLRLAYVITVHRSQGSEFETVILPVVKAQGRMLQRNLFYTAITRAKKKVWVLGDISAVQKAIDNDKVVLRNTGFGQAIHDSLGV